MNTIISPSDLVHVLIIKYFILSCRNSKPFTTHHQWSPIMVLCYLSNTIRHSNARQYLSLQGIVDALESFLSDTHFTTELLVYLSIFESFDRFVSAVESSQTVIQSDTDTSLSPNDLYGPHVVSPGSSLGVFIRSILAKWECLQFEELGHLFHHYSVFMKRQQTHVQQALPLKANGLSFIAFNKTSTYNSNDEGVASNMRYNKAQKAFVFGDVSLMESTIHSLHDYDGSDPLQIAKVVPVPGDNSSRGTSANIQRSLAAVLHCEDAAWASHQKHQHAMLSIARMWLSANNYTMALSAIEEALKTAQQRGDHITVAHGLLLLHELFDGSNDIALVAAAEDILVRCTSRCAALNLQHLTAQAALLLTLLRSKQPFRRHSHTLIQIEYSTDGDSDVERWSMGHMWSQLMCSMLGEIALTAQVITPSGITVDSEFAVVGTSHHSMVVQQQSQHLKRDRSQESPFKVTKDFISLSLQACAVAADLWMRAGMLRTAEHCIRRCLRQYHHLADAEDVVRLYVKLIMLNTDIVHSRVVRQKLSSSSVSNDNDPYVEVIQLTKMVRRLFFPYQSPRVQQVLDYASTYVLIHSSMVTPRDHQKALRLANRLVELSGSGVSDGRRQGKTDTALTEESIVAKLLLADTLLLCNRWSESQMLLIDLSNRCRLLGFTMWHCMCDAKRARGLISMMPSTDDDRSGLSSSISRPAALYQSAIGYAMLETVLSTSRKYNIGAVEAYISSVVCNR